MVPQNRLLNLLFIYCVVAFLISACNLTSSPQQADLTQFPTNTPLVTRTSIPTGGVPTTLPISTAFPTRPGGQSFPTSVLPPVAFLPTSTSLPISIVILSPIPGNVVAGNVQVLGAAVHPQFLQYQLEYGPDPNPGNLWFPASGIVQNPVVNGLLGIWNTTIVQDSTYQLRLRVILRDGSSLATVVNNIRIQNQAPTPIPSITPNIPRPIAAFTQDRSSGQAPLIVRFLNQSTGNITNYSWTFGDGGSSSEANPSYTFRSPGVYNVTLNVAGPGGTSNVSQQVNVQSATTPVAGFTQDKTSGASPLTVKFTNQSTGNITSYNWVFGDGTSSTEQSPSHQFTAVGTYNVILTVTGPGGSSSVTRKITVEDPVIPAPDAVFTVDRSSGDAPLTVQFVNQSTGDITGFNWDFGNGQTSADKNPIYTYENAGEYTVVLTAIGPGGQDTAQTTITVNQAPEAPVAAFTQDTLSGDVPLTIQFTDQSTGQIDTYNWEFGDSQTSPEGSPSHTFTTPGTYTVRLTVSGPGGSDTFETDITATQPIAPPDAVFTQDADTGTAPLTVQFTNQSIGESLSHSWNFGDGTGDIADVSPSHIYNSPGTYTVVLTVSNASGTDTAQGQIVVDAPAAKPVASFSPSTQSGDAPLTINFDASASSGEITSYAWDFGDGGTSAEPNPTYIFNSPGTFTVQLTVTGSGGVSEPATTVINVTETSAPTLPPIQRPVLFVSNETGNNDLYLLGTDGTVINLTNDSADDNSPVWSPDGSKIAFVSNRDGNNDVFVMNADGSGIVNITNNNTNNAYPVWSPDGSQIAFVWDRDGNNDVFVMNADGFNPVNLTNNPANDAMPAWSPDGAQLLFVSDRDGNNEIYVALVANSASVTNLTNNPANDAMPAWSPDGAQLLFVSDRDNGANLFTMNPDGSTPTNITNNATVNAASPKMKP